jgi:hypothetical protein
VQVQGFGLCGGLAAGGGMPHRFPALIAAPARGQGRLWLPGGDHRGRGHHRARHLEEIRHRVEHDLREELLAATGLVPLSWLMIGQWAHVPAQ